MTPYRKNYHPAYLELKNKEDRHVQEWISQKEEIIASAPFANALLKGDLAGIRRYKTGKLRIFYSLPSEKPALWASDPETPEIMFLLLKFRNEKTYAEAFRYLKREGLI